MVASSSANGVIPGQAFTWLRAAAVLCFRSPVWEHPLNVGVPSPGSQVLNNGFTSEDSHCRAGLRNLAAGTPICRHCTPTPPHPQDRTGQVGRSQRPHSKPGGACLPASGCHGGVEGCPAN